MGWIFNFYPRSPCGERLFSDLVIASDIIHFYPRSPCGERLQRQIEFERYSDISIHALLAESDTPKLSRVVPTPIFLSTLSLRRATRQNIRSTQACAHFYPRSPCGERPGSAKGIRSRTAISIHALLAESDWNNRQVTVHTWKFLSTLSLRRAT